MIENLISNLSINVHDFLFASSGISWILQIPVNIVDLGLVYNLELKPLEAGGSWVGLKMTLTAPGCGMGPAIAQDAERKIRSIRGVADVLVEIVWEPLWNRDMMTDEAKLQLGML